MNKDAAVRSEFLIASGKRAKLLAAGLILIAGSILAPRAARSPGLGRSAPSRFKLYVSNLAELYYDLGIARDLGWETNRNPTLAAHYYRLAANLGSPDAQRAVGNLYNSGRYGRRDPESVVFWWRKAAKQGNAAAQHDLAAAYLSGAGVSSNWDEAVKLFEESAAKGYPPSKYDLGSLLYRAQLPPKDGIAAVDWWKRAAADGVVDAEVCLGIAYFYGRSVPEDRWTAVRWFRSAAEHGSSEGQADDACCLAQGIAIHTNLFEALVRAILARSNEAHARFGRQTVQMHFEFTPTDDAGL